MQYFISFLEGIITFISPCLLPMLPIYVSYFAGDGEKDTRRVIRNALGFILGFTVVFVLLGALAGNILPEVIVNALGIAIAEDSIPDTIARKSYVDENMTEIIIKEW